MKILYVTGCAGFIGSHFTRLALKNKYRVYGVDKMTYASNEDVIEEFKKNKLFTFIKEDIRDLKHIHNCDAIVNFAAETHVDNSINSSAPFIESNVEGVRNLLELVRMKHGNSIDKPLFVQISTDEVYGDIKEGSFLEFDPLNPSNPYAASKASAEMLVTSWSRTYGIKYVIIRPTNNYGKGQYPEKLIPLAVYNLMNHKKIKLHNGGAPVRNWLHVEDTAEAILTVLTYERTAVENEKYNVSADFEQTNYSTADKIITSFFGKKEVFAYPDYIDTSLVRVGQDVRYSIDASKIKKLGWKPKRNFDKEIKSIVDFYKKGYKW